MAQMVKNLPAMWKIWVRSLGWEDLLEKGMATHSSILAWRIPWTEEPLWATVHGVAKSRTRQQLSTMISATKHLFMSLFKVLVIQSCPTLCDFMDCSLCPWNSPGKNTGVGCHFPLEGIFLTQGSNPCLQLGRQILYHCTTQEAWQVSDNFALSLVKIAILLRVTGLMRTLVIPKRWGSSKENSSQVVERAPQIWRMGNMDSLRT